MSVIENAFETKGTNVYFVNPAGNAVRQLTCPTGVTGLNGGTKDVIDTTCLSEIGAFRSNIGGFADPAEVQIPFILYDGDQSHADLKTLQDSGAVVAWMVALSDATTAPTLASDGLEAPTGRTTFKFDGFVSNLTFDIPINEVVRGNLTVKPSGTTTYQAAV
jgi:hypothetical protein